ncbi:hypothetical protein AB6A40_005700 [Gnathostoma spinigerum]|uniref:Fe2OG dioxygenase domain-containing protein n=1 Tax=Gnathostoma spinigerum TaxID=75299 RepID=A0ABD6EIB8_9BILA
METALNSRNESVFSAGDHSTTKVSEGSVIQKNNGDAASSNENTTIDLGSLKSSTTNCRSSDWWKSYVPSHFIIAKAPPTIRYIPDFITPEEEKQLMVEIYNVPKPKWQKLLNRRLQNWGGIVGKKALISDNNMAPWLTNVIDRIMLFGDGFPAERRPNHVLINEYLAGQGIMFQAHTDGPAFYPLIATVSLGTDAFLDYYKPIDPEKQEETKRQRYIGSLHVKPRSLLLVSDEMYTKYLHEIDERMVDEVHELVFNHDVTGSSVGETIPRGLRISLTIRNVIKVSKNDLARLIYR